MNPILKKELRTLLRERWGFLVPMAYAFVLVVSTLLVLVPASRSQGDSSEYGVAMTGTVAVIQFLAIALLAPLLGAGGISGERERGTFARLLASPLQRSRIGYGKVGAGVAYVGLLLVISLPVSVLAYQLGGTDLAALLGLYFTHALFGACLVSLGLLVSSYFERTWSSAMVAVTLPIGLTILNVAISFAMTQDSSGEASPLTVWVPVFNLGYSAYLFFSAGPSTIPNGALAWTLNLSTLCLVGLLSLAWLNRRLKAARG